MSAACENMTQQFEVKDNEDLNIVEVDEQSEQKEEIESKQVNGETSKGGLNSSNGSSGIGSLLGSPNCDQAANNSIYNSYSSGTDYSSQQDSSECGQSVRINANTPAFNSTKGSNYQVPAELMSKLNISQNIANNSNDNLSNLDEADGNQMYYSGMNYHSLPIGMGNNTQFDYDLFNNEFSGVDKQLAMQLTNPNVLDAVIGNKKNMDSQKQQLLAQAIAAANLLAQNTSNSGNNENRNRSLMENIDQLNSKFLNQKQSNDQNTQKNLNSLLAAASSFGQNTGDQMTNYNSPSSIKRQSTGAFMNPNVIFSTPIPPSTSPTNSNTANNRFNEANRFYSKQTNASNSPEKMNSMSASNSSFNIDTANNANASVNSAYEDDEVFSQNSSLNFSQTGNGQMPSSNQNIDMYQFYKTLLASNLNSSNISELLMNQSPNLSNLSVGSVNDILNSNNSNNFLNLSNLNNSFNQSKMNSFNQGNSTAQGANSNQSSLPSAAFAAAFFKQRQNNNQTMNNRSSANYFGAQSNNLNQNNLAQFLNTQSQSMNNNDPKRRVNSIATAYNFGSNSNNSPLFSSGSTHNVGPNASHLLQQSSLVSSAPFISSAANQSTASVLGNNSPLSQTISSLQNQSNSMMSNLENFANINSSPLHNSNPLMSFSSSSGSPLSNTLLSSSGKPLRSERLPPQMVEEIIKQAKIRRKQGGKKEVCVFCRNNGEKEQFFASHTLKDAQNNVACPVLRLYQCPICHANGDQAHTIKYCPYAEKDSPKLKEFSRLSAATALFLNSLNGGNTPPNSSPPETPSPLNQTPSQAHRLNFLGQGIAPSISSPNSPFAQALQFGNFSNFNLNNACLQGKPDLNMNVNKASNEVNNGLLATNQANIK